MKKVITLCLVGTVLALTACANKMRGDTDYSYENQAPYAKDRTVGGEKPADKVFVQQQHK